MLMKIRPLHKREAWQRALFSSSILPLHPHVDFESVRERWEKRAKGGGEGKLILFLSFFLLHFPSSILFFSGRVEVRETSTKYFSYFKLLHYAFFRNVTKAFLSKGDEIPLIIAM